MADFLIKIIMVLGLTAATIGITTLFKLKNDNVIEEIVEDVIQEEIGMDIDLTPQSPE